MNPARFVQEGDEVPGAGPVLQIKVALEIVRHVVGVPARDRGAHRTHNLLRAGH